MVTARRSARRQRARLSSASTVAIDAREACVAAVRPDRRLALELAQRAARNCVAQFGGDDDMRRRDDVMQWASERPRRLVLMQRNDAADAR